MRTFVKASGKMEALFSIVTVTWNAAGVLRPTLDSVKRQSFHGYEYLLVDGASSDETVAIAKAAGIAGMRITSEPDRGLYDAMNKAIDMACGRYLLFLNAGDALAGDDALERLAKAAKGNPGVIYGQTQLVDVSRQVVGMRHLTAPPHLTASDFKRGMLVCHQAFVARRDIAPHYDLRYRFSADYDWCIKVLKASPSNAYVGDAPIISFLEDGLTSKNHRASLLERYRIMCRNYGTLPTIARHISFIPRYLKAKLARR